MFNNNIKRNHAKHENAAQYSNKPAQRRRQRPQIPGRAARPAQRSRPTFIIGHTVTIIYYESIWLNPFTNFAFAISTLKNIPTFNLSYWMTCTRFSLNSIYCSVCGALPQNPKGALALDPGWGLPFLKPLINMSTLVQFLNTPLTAKWIIRQMGTKQAAIKLTVTPVQSINKFSFIRQCWQVCKFNIVKTSPLMFKY